MWIFLCFFLSCVCYAFMRVCLYVPCGHLPGKGWPCGSRLWCLTVSLSLPHWYPGSDVVLDCIDSWSLHPYLSCGKTKILFAQWKFSAQPYQTSFIVFAASSKMDLIVSRKISSTLKDDLSLNCHTPTMCSHLWWDGSYVYMPFRVFTVRAILSSASNHMKI